VYVAFPTVIGGRVEMGDGGSAVAVMVVVA
jgi:hypothetical protein